jgi:hypothetical protein
MRKILLILLIAVTGSLTGMAQSGPGMGRQVDPSRLVQAEKQLLLDSIAGLNDDQKLIIEAIYVDYEAAIVKARENMNPDDREAMRAGMNEIRTNKNAALKEILTEEQLSAFEEILARRREAMRQRRQNRNE